MNKPDCEPIEDAQSISNLIEWLENQAHKYKLKYLLAHADDGVIWGEFRDKKFLNKKFLITSGDDHVFPQFPKLRLCTLQQCRIFSENAEVMLWKISQDNWTARLINDEHLSENDDYISENQILWGTQAEAEKHGFTLLSDGLQGLKHAVPLTDITFKNKDYRPLRLKVRHYIYDDNDGMARIYLSRLVNLYADKP